MTLFFAGIGLIVVAALAAVLGRRSTSPVGYTILLVAGCAIAAMPAIAVLAGGTDMVVSFRATVPGGDWEFGLDPLSGVFLLTILGVGAASAVYGVGYMAAERGHRAIWISHAFVALLLVALALVVTARAVMPFLCAWELMAIGSYLLIVTDHEQSDVRRAGLIYLVATHTGTLALFLMFAVWGQLGSDWSFAALGAAGLRLNEARSVVFALALFGFGVKAGLVPLHFWLPPAHAAAPSHVSALMSGVVIKTGIYGILRVTQLLGVPPIWWGWTVLVLGAASGVLGVLWALAQHDIKRLLAYHSVENIGIILLGVGTGALGAAYGHPAIAMLGYAAAVLHTINHALFKSLLFMSAGAVLRMTGTRNMEELGGLARRMPFTWLAFLVGSAAIIGVPPLNGFVSEWLVYQGLFRAGQAAEGLRLAVLAAPVLALIGGLALACFAKVAGVVFLGQARTRRPLDAREVGGWFLAPLLVLTGACTVIGLFPTLVMPSLLRTGASIAREPLSAPSAALASVLIDSRWVSIFGVGVASLILIIWLGRYAMIWRRSVRTGETWACGFAQPSVRMQYTASSFASPLLSIFGRLSGAREQRGATVFHTSVDDLVLDRVALPWWERLHRVALRLRPIQQGRLHVYLIYIVATVIVLLAYLVLGPAR